MTPPCFNVAKPYDFVASDISPTGHWPGDEQADDVADEHSEPAELPPNVVRLTAGQLYRDAGGNVWNGRGRRPRWIVQALEDGASVDDFKVT